MRLSDLKVGESATVIFLHIKDADRKRLEEMGLTCGTSVTVTKKAPFGSPVLLKVRDVYLALRVEMLKKIEVKQ